MSYYINIPLEQYPTKCPYCGGNVNLVNAEKLFSKQKIPEYLKGEKLFVCENFPECNSYVLQAQNAKIQGFIADEELRKERKETHLFVDIIWKTKMVNKRIDCYMWLAKQMKITYAKTHIAMFDMKKCKKAQELCRQYILSHIQNIQTYDLLNDNEIQKMKDIFLTDTEHNRNIKRRK